jgi:hypothetical protein
VLRVPATEKKKVHSTEKKNGVKVFPCGWLEKKSANLTSCNINDA